MATIIVFASSLFLAALIVLIKAIELKYGKKNILLGLISKFDRKADAFVASLKFKGLQIIQSIRYIILVEAKAFFWALLIKIENRIKEEYRTRENTIMGRKNLKPNGSASFYLKKITEEKNGAEKGKIEEEL